MGAVFPLGLGLGAVLLARLLGGLGAARRLGGNVRRARRAVLDFQVLSLFGVPVRLLVVGRVLLVVVPSPVLAVAVVARPARGVRGLAPLVEFLVVPVMLGATLLMIRVLLRLVPAGKPLLSPGKVKENSLKG